MKKLLEQRGWTLEIESNGPAYKYSKNNLRLWWIPGSGSIALYDKNIDSECNIVFRGKCNDIQTFDKIIKLIS